MEEITICFTGDWMLGRDINGTNSFESKFATDDKRVVYDNKIIKEYMERSDLIIGNLETTITDHDKKEEKVFNFRIKESNRKWIKPVDVKMFFNIANNHILDYGKQGMIDTMKNLDELDIKYTGAGRNLYEARKVIRYNIKGKNIGIISASDHYKEWMAKNDKGGINYIDYENYQEYLEYIKQMKNELMIEILILSIHWGGNYQLGIKDVYKRFAHDVMKVGVDIIHGHSSHHVKCIKSDGRKLIIYGNGDFINDYMIDKKYKSNLGMIIKVNIRQDKTIQFLVVPTIINDRNVSLNVNEEDKKWVYNMIKNDCMIALI